MHTIFLQTSVKMLLSLSHSQEVELFPLFRLLSVSSEDPAHLRLVVQFQSRFWSSSSGPSILTSRMEPHIPAGKSHTITKALN